MESFSFGGWEHWNHGPLFYSSIMYICVQERASLCWSTNILRKKKYSAQQDDFLNSYKTNNGPMSFLPIDSRCTQRLTRLSSSCFVAHVSSESLRRSIVPLKQYSLAQSPLCSWSIQVQWLLVCREEVVLDPLNRNVFLSSLTTTKKLSRCRLAFSCT